MKTFFSEIYGCQMNISDIQELEAVLENRGWVKAPLAKEANVVLINSCAVRQTAEDRVLAHLGFYKSLKEKKNFLLIFMGCVASKEKRRILERYPFVDYVIGPSHRHLIPDLIESYEKKDYRRLKKDLDGRIFTDTEVDDIDQMGISPVVDKKYPFRAFLTIIQGCSKYCTYCIVPYTRGGEKSVPSSFLLEQVESFALRGVKEIYLLGQNVNSYGLDSGDISFAQLLKQISHIAGIQRIQFISSHPRDVNSELIQELAYNPKISRHLHLALQSGSDTILKKMNRQHTLEEFREKILELRRLAPDFQISTDIIVGFPFEGEKEYEETKQALLELRFSNAFIYMYSERKETASSHMQDIIPLAEKKRRVQELMEIQKEITLDTLQKKVGQRAVLLVEDKGTQQNQWKGFTQEGFRAVFESSQDDTINYRGEFLNIEVYGIRGMTLLARLI